MSEASITFRADGSAACLHTDLIPLHTLGALSITRASTIEFNDVAQEWEVRLSSSPDRVAFADVSRAACLAWEHHIINSALS